MTSPSEQIVAAATALETRRDSLGRELTFKRLNALDRLRLFKALGPALSQNSAYLGMAMLAATVTVIDGIPVPASSTEAHIEALVAKLGDPGIAAAADSHAASQGFSLGSATPGN